MSKKKNNSKKKSLASKADRHDLYLKSVQCPEHEVWFLNKTFKKEFGRPAALLREDFCGTAAVCYEWVKKKTARNAIGVDIDPDPLQWGRENLTANLSQAQLDRVQLLQQDVRIVNGQKADIVAGQNFSYWIFKTRPELLGYFKSAHANLADEGILMLDMMGGQETLEEDREEITRKNGFKYIWEQKRFDPITHDCSFYIHFRFKDGSELKKAFEYHWRLWTIPEVTELLAEAGFDRVDVYWEGTDPKTGEGNDVYRVKKHAPSDPSWIAYIVGVKSKK